jgi:hypothetical protein
MVPTPSDFHNDWSFIESHMPSSWRAHAKAAGLGDWDEAPSPNAKVTDVAKPVRVLLHHIGTDSSLKISAASAAAGGLIDVSAVAVHKWMRKAAAFFRPVLVEMTASTATFASDRWAGYELVATDGSSLTEPGGTGTSARVHYALRLVDLQPIQVEVTDEHEGETLRRFRGKPGQLWMGDRCYANPPGVASMHDAGAHVLLRFNRGSLPLYDVHGNRIDVATKMSRLTKPLRSREWAAWVHPEGHAPIRGRLCALRLPADKVEEARKRLRKEQGSDVTAESLEMAAFVVVFTTAPADRLTTEQILELYRLRWQIELEFKREKSIAGLKRLPNFRSDTIAAWLLGKLLLVQIARAIADRSMPIPPGGHRGAAEPSQADAGDHSERGRTGTSRPSRRDHHRNLARHQDHLAGDHGRPAADPTV